MALQRKRIMSPNYSSRGGSSVRLIVLHTAEGSTSIESLGSFFQNPSSGVSSHTGIDDKAGICGEYVDRGNKAWTASNANPVAVQTELCAFAKWDTAEWNRHPNMLNNCAQWVKEEAAAFGIPIVKLSASQAQGGGRGVCQHVDLGSWGGGHWDCGPGFPMDSVLSMASGEAPIAPGPTPPTTPPKPGGPAPPFPYPADHYLGRPDPDPHCHSGFYGGVDTTNVRTWQQQMANRGWAIGIDGQYGDQSYGVCRSFQEEKGLGVDGLVGPNTWAASWTAPVT
jgi:hypothetical protein